MEKSKSGTETSWIYGSQSNKGWIFVSLCTDHAIAIEMDGGKTSLAVFFETKWENAMTLDVSDFRKVRVHSQ
jgi:hypothetical protein